ncbi:MAG TPA: class I SAM-dependent methyltransferase [Ignavibacteria bacterium]|nr:class I SAM-dependent methyltransferase [Ignavibacteria bacterium]
MSGSEYNKIAKYYDKVFGDTDETENYLKKKLLQLKFRFDELPELLELGCGTGINLLSLRGLFNVTGIDNSRQMLKIAAQKLPGSEFYLKDIRDFSLNKKFDLILCLYDTINHLTLFSDWKKIFINVFKHLKKNGVFIFDINTLYKLNFISAISPIINEFDSNYLLVHVNKINRNKFNWNLKVFEKIKKNNFDLIETNIQEASFEKDIILKELSKYFKIERAEEESGRKADKNSERIYFICRKMI